MENKFMVKNLQVLAGSILFPLAVVYFIQPAGLNSGGFVGLSQIIAYLLPTGHFDATGIVNLCFNIPLFMLAYKGVGKKFFFRTLFSVLLQAVLMSFLPVQDTPVMADTLSNTLVGGVIAGIGIGLCLRGSASAGGMDILGVYLSKVQPDFSVGKLSYLLNAFVLGLFAIMFDLQVALYSLIFIVLAYFVSDRVHVQNITATCTIITTSPLVKQEIMKRLGRGVTCWQGKGAYTGKSSELMITVVNQYEVRYVKSIVKACDPKAFLLVSPSKAILGNFEKRPTE